MDEQEKPTSGAATQALHKSSTLQFNVIAPVLISTFVPPAYQQLAALVGIPLGNALLRVFKTSKPIRLRRKKQ